MARYPCLVNPVQAADADNALPAKLAIPLAVTLLAIGVCTYYVVQAAINGEETDLPYRALPSFSYEKFSEIRVGMTGQEVRALIGNPCQRYTHENAGEDGAIATAWRYTFPTREGLAPYRYCAVVFDRNTKCVVSVRDTYWDSYNGRVIASYS